MAGFEILTLQHDLNFYLSDRLTNTPASPVDIKFNRGAPCEWILAVLSVTAAPKSYSAGLQRLEILHA